MAQTCGRGGRDPPVSAEAALKCYGTRATGRELGTRMPAATTARVGLPWPSPLKPPKARIVHHAECARRQGYCRAALFLGSDAGTGRKEKTLVEVEVATMVGPREIRGLRVAAVLSGENVLEMKSVETIVEREPALGESR